MAVVGDRSLSLGMTDSDLPPQIRGQSHIQHLTQQLHIEK